MPVSKHLLALRTNNGFVFKKLDEITHLTSEGSYTWIHTEDTRKFLSSQSLKSILKRIETPSLVRISRSHAINRTHFNFKSKEKLMAEISVL